MGPEWKNNKWFKHFWTSEQDCQLTNNKLFKGEIHNSIIIDDLDVILHGFMLQIIYTIQLIIKDNYK